LISEHRGIQLTSTKRKRQVTFSVTLVDYWSTGTQNG